MFGDSAEWVEAAQVDGTTVWLWHAEYAGVGSDPDAMGELRANGYERIDSATHPALPEILHSQLAPLVVARAPGHTEPEIWANAEDIAHAQAVPVVLAFSLAGQMMTALARDGATRYPTAQVIPPPHLGNCALVVLDANAREWSTAIYGIRAMPDEARDLHKRLAEALEALAGGSAMWPHALAIQAVLQSGEYERQMRDAQAHVQAAQTDAERTIWSQFQAGLDASLSAAQTIRRQREQRRRDPQTWAAQWQEIHQMAQQLAAAYWEVHEARAALSEKRKTITHLPPSALDAEGKMPVPTAMPVLAFLTAYSQARAATRGKTPAELVETMPDLVTTQRGWVRTAGGFPVHIHTTDKYRTELHVVDPQQEEEAKQLEPAQLGELAAHLWAQVAAFDDLDGDILLCRLAHFLTAQKDTNGRVWISADHILRYRGRDPKINRSGAQTWDGGMRREDMALISAHSAHLDRQWVSIHKETRDSGDGHRDELSWKSALFLVAEKVTYSQLFDVPAKAAPEREASTPEPAAPATPATPATPRLSKRAIMEAAKRAAGSATSFDVAWLYEPGTWWEAVKYDDAGREQITKMSQGIVAYDPYHETWEKRLARYAFFHLRMNATKGMGTITRKVRTLFDELGLELEPRNPARTREHFEQAMGRIVADGYLDRWTYRADNSALPARGWLEHWLNWNVQMIAQPLVRDHYAELAASRAALMAQLHPTRHNRKRAREAAGGADASGKTAQKRAPRGRRG